MCLSELYWKKYSVNILQIALKFTVKFNKSMTVKTKIVQTPDIIICIFYWVQDTIIHKCKWW